MSNCEEALAINTSLISQFESCITNFKKAGGERKKSIPFLQMRINTLTGIFKQIQENDISINSFKTEETAAYSKSESFLKIDDRFHNFLTELMEAIDKLSTPPISPFPIFLLILIPLHTSIKISAYLQ